MKHISHTAILIFAMAAFTACGDATPDPTSSGVSANLSAAAVFDAAGTWKAESNTCSVPVPSQFANSVTSTSNDVQTFSVPGFQTDGPGTIVTLPSEGTLNAQTGAYTLCYSSDLTDCQMKCTGIVDAANHVDLNCNKSNGDLICTMALQK